MNATSPEPVPLTNPYTLRSVKAVSAPSGAVGTRWHRYEIAQGANTIVGYIEGAMDSVTRAAEAMVVRLNERRSHERGRVHLALRSKRRAS